MDHPEKQDISQNPHFMLEFFITTEKITEEINKNNSHFKDSTRSVNFGNIHEHVRRIYE